MGIPDHAFVLSGSANRGPEETGCTLPADARASSGGSTRSMQRPTHLFCLVKAVARRACLPRFGEASRRKVFHPVNAVRFALSLCTLFTSHLLPKPFLCDDRSSLAFLSTC